MASLGSVCSLCGKSVLLTDCKIDEQGKAVHGTCYAAKVSSARDRALRPWRQIARELAAETNSKRILELSLELDGAIAAQGTTINHGISGEKKEHQQTTNRADGGKLSNRHIS